ncbi:HupE/UreJ family protein [uncultured Massilia sp.]|uniref:HupE/UreJ family protein n=1 Tax=uncultured Massilia sp. TaxID=169973 RepID=UPI0025859D49|nr:HupE/UreJ family protein [uncultured Massilia sp.]
MKYPIAFILSMSAAGAWAHSGHGAAGFGAGLLHPLLGLDHWLAMLGLGLWSRAAGVPRQALVTVGACLALGAFTRLALPLVEPLLAASVLVAGLMGLGAARLPARLGLVLAGAFSLVHGHAHGQEMAGAAAATGAICMSMGLMALGWLAAGQARLERVAPALVAVLGAGLLVLA